MSDALRQWAAEYAAAFREYLDGADEAALQRAYELGHAAMAGGLRMLDLAAVHHEALAGALGDAGTPEETARATGAAASFFMESLSPFEMTHRGFLEANATLRLLNQTLEQQVEAVQAARAAAEAAAWRSRFLAEASMRLDAALDYPSRLAIAARLAVPDLADYCFIDAVEENGEIGRREATATGPAAEALHRERQRPPPHSPPVPAAVSGVLRTGRPELWPELAGAQFEALAGDAEDLQQLRSLGLQSAMIVPLPARGRTLAVMTLLTAAGRRCGAAELALAEDFARRAAITLDNARLYREVQEAAQRKDEFLATLAHELRNPLAPVAHSLYLLRHRGDDAATRERARAVMERQVRHLTHLIDDLLDVSRIIRGKILLRYERLDLTALVHSGAEDHRPALAAASLTLVTALPATPMWVMGDSTRLAQMLDNLLGNAGKFTEPGGTVTVRLETGPTAHWATITVQDTGIGIEPATLTRVFDSFAQADRTLDRSRGGLGLGLSVVKGLAELHGGEVSARSAGLGQGAEFTVTLPLEREGATGRRGDGERGGRGDPTTTAPAAGPSLTLPVVPVSCPPVAPSPRRPVAPRRVLVVEDNRDAAELLKTLLEMSGHEVHLAFTGPEGVAAARQLRPEVVLCDLGLPGIDGYGVAAALRQEPATATACLIAISGYGQEEDRRRCQAAGFDEHLLKPVEFAVLERLLGGTGDAI